MPTATSTANSHVARLFDGPLDVVGDVHGEFLALRQLLRHLGYRDNGEHPGHRRLVFVGDLCDRGPDSPAVIALVRELIERQLAQCVLGNHELNVLRQERKPGNGWIFDEHPDHQRRSLADCRRATGREREDIRRFFGTMPLALERDDLRVVHAAWHDDSLSTLSSHRFDTLAIYRHFEAALPALVPAHVSAAADREKRHWSDRLHDPAAEVPLLANLAAEDEIYQTANPVRVLTSGLEQRCEQPFYASGKWRMVTRVPWWREYAGRPVIVGHYWRWWSERGARQYSRGEPDLFAGSQPLDWLGASKRVYCADFSVGARFRELEDGHEPGQFTRLAAVRCPDNVVVFDNGERHDLIC
jgi:hypothetical protein